MSELNYAVKVAGDCVVGFETRLQALEHAEQLVSGGEAVYAQVWERNHDGTLLRPLVAVYSDLLVDDGAWAS